VPAAADHGQGDGKAKGRKPTVIELPRNFGPEGITTARRHAFFVGSQTTGAIYRGSLRTAGGATSSSRAARTSLATTAPPPG
jgi:hypothetical protein